MWDGARARAGQSRVRAAGLAAPSRVSVSWRTSLSPEPQAPQRGRRGPASAGCQGSGEMKRNDVSAQHRHTGEGPGRALSQWPRGRACPGSDLAPVPSGRALAHPRPVGASLRLFRVGVGMCLPRGRGEEYTERGGVRVTSGMERQLVFPSSASAEVGAQHVGLLTGVGGSPEAPPPKAPFCPLVAPGESFASSRGKWENRSADPKRA